MLYRKYIILTAIVFISGISAQMINRYGTTTGNFLEIGVDSEGSSMGEAFVAVTNNISSIYWNPAGLSNIKTPTLSFMSQPWLVGIDMTFTAGALIIPGVGNIGFGLTQMNYGDMDVTTLEYQEGTGEKFTASDMAATLTFSRKIVSWFAFGSSLKYIRSNIWHSSASAVAVDLGVLVNTKFFSFSRKEEDGMNIGMSISNYGTRMKFDGIDIYQPVDISEFEEGNYGDVAGQFRPSQWELPLIFRIGVALKPLVTNISKLTVSADALHPNNNSESINVGAALDNNIPGVGVFSIRGGVKAIYMDNPEYGYTAGLGLKMFYLGNKFISVDYGYKAIGLLGNVHVYSFGFSF